MRRIVIVALTIASLAPGCGMSDEADVATEVAHRLFGETVPLSDVAGTEIVTSQVVPMRCIPARIDPVGVFLGLQIVGWSLDGDAFEVSLRTNHARLGSHPSGCSDPVLVMEDSMFLLGPDDETVHASHTVEANDATTLVFDLDGRSPEIWSAVLLPTIDYELHSGERQTSIFGFVAHYALV